MMEIEMFSETAHEILVGARDLLETGGPVVGILTVMSVLALTIASVKIWQFRSARVGDRKTAAHALQLYLSGKIDDALLLASRSRNPVAQTLARAIRGQRHGAPEMVVREDVACFGADILESLRSWLRALEVIASLAPLLGLFGTVLGMIQAFRQLEAAGNQVNPAVLSGGIWEALLTTAVGLAVAIPVVAILSWLERRLDRLEHDMDSAVTRVFTESLWKDDPDVTQESASHAPAKLRPATAAATR